MSMLEAMKSLRDEMHSMKKASDAEADKTSASLSKAGPSKPPDPTTRASDPTTQRRNLWTLTYMVLLFHQSSLKVSNHGSKHCDLQSDHSNPHSDYSEQPVCVPKLRSTRTRKNKVRAKYYSQSSSSEEDQPSVPVKKSAKPQQAPEHDQQQDSTDPVFYREVDMSDLPSQYAEEVETFRYTSTSVLGLDDKKG